MPLSNLGPHDVTIGDLERRAGIGPDHESRWEFWRAFTHLKTGSFDAGVAELKRRIAAAEKDTANE